MKQRRKILSGILAATMVLNMAPFMTVTAEEADAGQSGRNVAHRLYVSAEGNDDTGSGTKENPFASIERAKEAVRELSKSDGDIVVEIGDGFYYLDETLVFEPEDSGNENCTIYYEAAEGANPVISGGKVVEGEWTDEGNGIYSVEYKRDRKLRALYVNGERAYMTSRKLTGLGGNGTYEITAGESDWAWISGSQSAGTLFENGSIPVDTINPDDIELMTQTTWNTAIVCVDNLEQLSNGQISANYQMPYGAIAQSPGWGNNYKVSGDQTVYNVFEWLDEPGEFYFDKTGNRLYYYPREGEDLADAQVVVPELETLVEVQGTDRENRVHDISFENLTFAYTDWNLYEVDGSYGRATVQGAAGVTAYADGNWHNSIYRAYDVGPGAVMVNSATELSFKNNTICHTGNDGLSLVNDAVDIVVDGNVIYDLAGSGLLIGHPQHIYIGDKGSGKGDFSEKEKYDADVEGNCQNIQATNNFISGTSNMFWGDAGVMIFIGEDLDIQHNHIEDTPYTGLSLGWGWWNMNGTADSVVPGEPSETTKNNTVSNNVFLNTIRTLGDGGAIYTLGDMPGTTISNNYICGLGTPGTNPYHIRGIHVDEGTQHVYGEKNVFEIPTDLTCIDCGNWGNKGNNTWDNNYSTSDSYTTTGNYEPGTVITNKHTNKEGVWGTDVFEILSNAGLESGYLENVPDALYKVQDRLLPTQFYLAADQTLDLNIEQSDINGEIWLAPEGTEDFVEGDDMTRASGGKINTPKSSGSYKLYIVDGENISEPSKGEITVAGGSLAENIEEGGSYRTSQAKPFEVLLREGYVKSATLNGEEITSGYKIDTEGSHELIITDINDAVSEIHFETYIERVDELFPRNMTKEPEELAYLEGSDEGTTAWFVPQDTEITDVSQLEESDSMTKTETDEIAVPRTPGKYVLYLVNGNDISKPSDAVLTVTAEEFSVTEGLLARFNADDLEEGAVSQWTDSVNGYILQQNETDKQPSVKVTDLGMKYVDFDGVSGEMAMDAGQSLDLNGKSNLSIVAFSAYTGEDPIRETYGDTNCTLYFGESGSWGSIYLSSYSGFIVSRFGSGQGDNFVKVEREQPTTDFVMTAMVKDGTTEYLYDAGEKVATAEGKYEETANNKTALTVGRTASGTPSYFKGGISEILIYDRTLSDEEIASLQIYMMGKYYLENLNPVVTEAEEILFAEGAEDKYNENSWNNLEDAYRNAIDLKNRVSGGENVGADAVKEAYNELRNAIDDLQEVITTIPSGDLNLWLKADEGVVLDDEGKIVTWRDSSGAGNHAVVAQNPQEGETVTAPQLIEDGYYGKPVVRFNGSSDGMQFPFGNIDQSEEITVVIVSASKSEESDTAGGDNRPLLYFHEYGSGWGKFVVTPTSDNINARFGSGNAADGGGYICYDRPESIGDAFSTTVVSKNGSEETIYVGDQLVMTKNNGAAKLTNIADDTGYLGRYPVGSQPEYWYNQSDVAEIMIYNRALGLAEIQQINAYLNEKYSPEPTLESISTEGPEKTEYAIGEELDLTGLKVTAHYSDGSSEEIAAEECEISGFDSGTAGEKVVTVSYGEKTTEFTVVVNESKDPVQPGDGDDGNDTQKPSDDGNGNDTQKPSDDGNGNNTQKPSGDSNGNNAQQPAGGDNHTSPQTGDTLSVANVIGLSGLCILCLGLIAFVAVKKRK